MREMDMIDKATDMIQDRYTRMADIKAKLFAHQVPVEDMSQEEWAWRKTLRQEISTLYDEIQSLKDTRHQLYQELRYKK